MIFLILVLIIVKMIFRTIEKIKIPIKRTIKKTIVCKITRQSMEDEIKALVCNDNESKFDRK